MNIAYPEYLHLDQVNEPSVQDGFTSASFHPDGLILGTGTAESLVRIWDVKSQVCVSSLLSEEYSLRVLFVTVMCSLCTAELHF